MIDGIYVPSTKKIIVLEDLDAMDDIVKEREEETNIELIKKVAMSNLTMANQQES